jgi:NTE family protein
MTVAFALSGGGNLGALQAGSVLALVEAGIEPDLLVGTSVGALNAAFLATRPGVDGARHLVRAWGALRRNEAVRLGPLAVLSGFLGITDHLLSPTHLRKLVKRWVEVRRIEDASIRLAVTGTDALTGEAIVMTSGDLVTSLLASSAIPGLFPPVRVGDRWLIDGSLAANRPILQAQTLGADDVYVITTETAPRRRPPRGAVAMAMNSVSLVTARVSREELAQAAARSSRRGGQVFVVPSPEPEAPGPFDYRRGVALAEAAYRRAVEWLEEGALPVDPPTLERPSLDRPISRRPRNLSEADAHDRHVAAKRRPTRGRRTSPRA